MSESNRFYWLDASRFTINLHIEFIKNRVDNRNRTGSISVWKTDAPPFMRYRHSFKKDNPDMNVRS